jgi:inosine-uridine nucleoside N-ribohydrolase
LKKIKMAKKIQTPTLIDCDPGVDDAFAIALALASPEIDLRAITTVHGNVPARMAYRNARRVVSFLGVNLRSPKPLPAVYPGAGLPLRGGRIDRKISISIHGEDGLGDLFRKRKPPAPGLRRESRVASQVIASLSRGLGGSLSIIAIGPLTNLALAVRRDRKALAGVGRIVIMGGAAQVPGNATRAAEFNVHCDPEAAEVVMNCGAPITMIGLNVTRRAVLPSRSLGGGGEFRGALRDLARPYIGFSKRRRGVDGVTLHDPLAVAAALEPGLVGCLHRKVSVECGSGPARGMTVVDLRPGADAPASRARSAEVAMEVDEKRFLRLFLSRLKAYRGWS